MGSHCNRCRRRAAAAPPALLPVAGALLALLCLVSARDPGLHATQHDHGERHVPKAAGREQEDTLEKALDLLRTQDGGQEAGARLEGEAAAGTSLVEEEPLPERPLCTPDDFPQMEHLRGHWRPHANSSYRGLYDADAQCAAHHKDWQCHENAEGPMAEVLRREYAQEYHPDACQLRPFSPGELATCLKDRRLVMIGDSLMRQQFYSLGCLLSEQTMDSGTWAWDEATHYPVQGDYVKDWRPGYNFSVHKQFLGDFTTRTGLKVSLRTFGILHEQLWDDVMSEFLPLQPDDIVMVNFGAWYPRFKWQERDVPWQQWQKDMTWLIDQRLSQYPCKVIMKEYAPTHFGGHTGTFTGIEESLPGLPAKDTCSPVTVGEYWYDVWMREKLQACGGGCSHIHMLPIYQASLTRTHSHFGTFGRGRGDRLLDCRHFCQNVVDLWSVILYNKFCP